MVSVKNLFSSSRFPEGSGIISVIIYFPLGICLAIVRMFIGLHTLLVASILPVSSFRSFILRGLFGVLGIQIVVTEDNRKKGKSSKLLVSNHVSELDQIIFYLITNNFTPCNPDTHAFLRKNFGYKDFGREESREKFIRNIKKHLQDSSTPVLFYPEKTTTNGAAGMLKFSSFPFELKTPVQPISIAVTRLGIPITLTTLEGSFWWDIFWCLFTPCTIFKVKFLALEEPVDGEDCEAYAHRVQISIAKSINIKATRYTFTDKAEYKKKLQLALLNQTTTTSATSGPSHAEGALPLHTQKEDDNPPSSGTLEEDLLLSLSEEMRKMVLQVKDVLPHVSISVIIRTLELTGDVDITITNILEGSTENKVEDIGKTGQKRTPSQTNYSLQFKAKDFGKSLADRQLSYAERKKAMIEMAQQRYKEKHGLL
ncbi:hypothetical protein CHS0354_004466 [Potamilus streckersoni]|uniref:CUE domain-containing protein n=1 Tax=Potamilus streckersoni TaxID=2493646 RepID=A0AAE0SPL9_9BIVA|nr:hypothetical protein CHS0354_004466 [Potamilus streckersoni]